MATSKETVQKILDYFDTQGWLIPDVASALNVSEQYLRRVLNNPEKTSETNHKHYCSLQN